MAPDVMQRLLNARSGVRTEPAADGTWRAAYGVLAAGETGFIKKGDKSAVRGGSNRALPGALLDYARRQGVGAGQPGVLPAKVVDGRPGLYPGGGRAR